MRCARSVVLLVCILEALSYAQGTEVVQDAARAVALERKACDGGDMSRCAKLAYRYANGTGVAQDAAKAVALFQKACDGGEMRASKHLGRPARSSPR